MLAASVTSVTIERFYPLSLYFSKTLLIIIAVVAVILAVGTLYVLEAFRNEPTGHIQVSATTVTMLQLAIGITCILIVATCGWFIA